MVKKSCRGFPIPRIAEEFVMILSKIYKIRRGFSNSWQFLGDLSARITVQFQLEALVF
jgi:hypothetical protein